MKFKLVRTVAELDSMINQMESSSKIIGSDTETTGLSARKDKLRLIQLNSDGNIYLVDCFAFDSYQQLDKISKIFADTSYRWIFHNYKFDAQFIFKYLGARVSNVFDTYIADTLIDFPAGHRLADISLRYLSTNRDKTEQKSDWSGELTESQLQYAADDVVDLAKLREIYITKLQETSQLKAAKLEFDAIQPIAEMELRGFAVDYEKYSAFVENNEKIRNEKEKALLEFLQTRGGKRALPKQLFQEDIFGDLINVKTSNDINVGSWQQVLPIYQEMGIPITSTDQKVIGPLLNEYPDLKYLIEHREWAKLCSAFGKTLLEKIEDGRIYSELRQLGAITSRMSGSNPNLMQLPNTEECRSCFSPQAGRKLVVCLEENSLVATDDGLIKIKDIVPGKHKVYQEDGSFCAVSSVVDNGIRETFRVELAHGYFVEATEEHLFQVLDANSDLVWKKTKDITVDDYFLLKGQSYFGNSHIRFPEINFNHFSNNKSISVPEILNAEFSELLGMIVGNGSFENSELRSVKLCVASRDTDLAVRAKYLLSKYFSPTNMKEQTYRGITEFSIYSKPLSEWLIQIGLSKSELPDFILTSSKDIVCAFLRGYFETDGSASSSKCVKIASSRQKIIEQTHILLYSLGVVSALTKNANVGPGRKFTNWSVTIPQSQCDKFKRTIGFISSRKKSELDKIVSLKSKGTKFGGVPNLFNKVIEEWDVLCNYTPCRNIRFGGKLRTLSTQSISEFEERFPQLIDRFNTKLISHCNLNLFKVKSIARIGSRHVYDITVPETSKFLANNIVTHNCDYAGYELRILADISNDPVMLDAFNSGKDLHSMTAAGVFGIPYEEAKTKYKEKRTAAKIGNFSIVYGINPIALMNRLKADGVEADEDLAKKIIDGFYDTYRGAARWLFAQEKLVLKNNNLRGLAGHLMRVNLVRGDRSSERSAGRDARNWPIQNLNAVSTKRAMKLIHNKLIEKGLDEECYMTLPVHDEIVAESTDRHAEEVRDIVQWGMETAGQEYLKKVKVVAEAAVCNSWADKS